jgi:hypothetical protein
MVVTPETSKVSVGEYKANESYPEFYPQLATPRMTISDFERKRQANEDKSRPIDLRKGVRTIPQVLPWVKTVLRHACHIAREKSRS